MNVLRFGQAAAMVTALSLIPASFAQAPGGDKVDLDALAQIKTEAFQHSQVLNRNPFGAAKYARFVRPHLPPLSTDLGIKSRKWAELSVRLFGVRYLKAPTGSCATDMRLVDRHAEMVTAFRVRRRLP